MFSTRPGVQLQAPARQTQRRQRRLLCRFFFSNHGVAARQRRPQLQLASKSGKFPRHNRATTPTGSRSVYVKALPERVDCFAMDLGAHPASVAKTSATIACPHSATRRSACRYQRFQFGQLLQCSFRSSRQCATNLAALAATSCATGARVIKRLSRATTAWSTPLRRLPPPASTPLPLPIEGIKRFARTSDHLPSMSSLPGVTFALVRCDHL